MKGHWAGTVRKLCIQWSVRGLHIFIKTQPKWTIWPPPISLSSSLWASANSMFTPLPGTASFLPAPTLCVQLSCSSFFITTLGPGPSSSTNNAPDCCRPQKPCLSPSSGPALVQRALVSTTTAALDCVLGSSAGGCWLLLEQTYLD